MSFEFDCPRCGRRCRIDPQQRGEAVACAGCRVVFPGPDFPLRPSGVSRGAGRRSLGRAAGRAPAPAGQAAGNAPELETATFATDESEARGAEWQRSVAKVFTAAERSYSLHHLMLGVRRFFSPDSTLPAEARRRFEFYCGACGRLQGARVWDIASQTCCVACGELMIVPSPPHRPRHAISAESAEPADALYCPGCGQAATVSDRRRVRHSYCERCADWF